MTTIERPAVELVEILPRQQMSRAELAAASFLIGYRGNTFESYKLDLQIFYEWCAQWGLDVLDDVTRAHLELFARYLETERHNVISSMLRRMYTLRCFYRLCAYDGVIPTSPAEHMRLPKLYIDESATESLDRDELAALVACARASTPSDAALIVLMAYLGLRVSEACSILIENIHGRKNVHRTLSLIGKGGKPVTIPVPSVVGDTLDLAAGGRTSGFLLLRRDGLPMDRRAANRVVIRLCKWAGITKHISSHSLRHSFVTACLDAGIPLREVQVAARHSDPRQTARYDRGRGKFENHANYRLAEFIGEGQDR